MCLVSSKGVISIVEATPSGSRIVLIEMPADRVVISVLGCWSGEWIKFTLRITHRTFLRILLSVLKDWWVSKQGPTNSGLIVRFRDIKLAAEVFDAAKWLDEDTVDATPEVNVLPEPDYSYMDCIEWR